MDYVVEYAYPDLPDVWHRWSYYQDQKAAESAVRQARKEDLKIQVQRTWRARKRPRVGIADWLFEERRMKL